MSLKISREQASLLLSALEGYKAPLVDIDTFLDDPIYLGFLSKKIYPKWREVLRDIFPNPYKSPCFEVCFGGAIGTGKTTIARIILLYNLYKTLMIADPHKKFNLIETDFIVFALFTADMKLAEKVLYEPFRELIRRSPFFASRVIKGLERGPIEFPNKIIIEAGSRFTHALGMAVMSGILDEANFQSGQNQAFESYTALARRMDSRFLQAGGTLPGHLVLVSSEKDKSSFLTTHIEKAKRGIKVYKFALWEVKKHLGIYSGRTFKVFVGSERKDPFIVRDGEEARLTEEDWNYVIDVPVELSRAFELDLEGAIRDIAGRAVVSSNRFFAFAETLSSISIMSNLVEKDSFTLSLKGDDSVMDYLKTGYFKHIVDKYSPRYIHIDTGLTQDRLGIAASYVSGEKTVDRFDATSGSYKRVVEPYIVCEFAFGVQAEKGSEIPFYKIREFIFWLRDMGYPIAKISLDGFQSADMRQQLNLQGFEAVLLSMDRTPDPYLSFKSAALEKRIAIPNNSLLLKELRFLERTEKGKIDHPLEFPDGTRGSKDIADAVAGSYYLAITSTGDIQPQVILAATATKEEKSIEEEALEGDYWASQF